MSSLEELKSKLNLKLVDDIEAYMPKGLSADKVKKIYEEVGKEYELAKVAPGESVGIISAESIGEPGTQMSVQASEKIIIKINNRIKTVKIGEFVDNLMGLKGSLKINKESEVLPLNDIEVCVPSINQDEKIEWKKVIEVSRHRPNKKLMKITTSSGREITSTDNHSFVTRINNSVLPIKGTELKVGDRIPVLNKFSTENVLSEIRMNDIIKHGSVDSDGLLHGMRGTSKPIGNNIKLDFCSGWFMGAYLAEGSCNGGAVAISNINDDYINNTKKFASKINMDWVDRSYEGEYGPGRSLSMHSTPLAKFIALCCGQLSMNKAVPEFAYNASDEFVSGLLRGYFDGDGNFTVNRKMIRASSNSKELVDGMALLLSRFKIFSFKTKDKKGQHWLLIPYKYAPLFLSHIGSSIEYKYEALQKLADKAKSFWNDKSLDYTDMISGFGDLFHKTAKKLGYPARYVNNFTKRQKIGRTALYRYMKIFEELSKNKNIDVNDELNVMRRMFNSDVIWDSIEKIEYVDDEHEYVYDLSVPGLETFTTSEGIITHNTLNTFHFAGVAEMNVTMGLPRLIEILDGRKTIETPTMEIYLKEPYKSGKNIKELAVQIKETRLGELVKEFVIDLAENAVSFVLDDEKTKMVGATPGSIVKAIEKSTKLAVKQSGKEIIVPVTSKEAGVNEVYKLKELLRHVFVAGIKGITQVLPIKRGNEFVIITAGTNLKTIMGMEAVDTYKTNSNDIFEIYDVLGIEAARAGIINEIFKVIESQGLNVDERHIMLVADMMTADGSIKGITRYGIIGEKSSVLARASFETPIKHLINAALIGEKDPLNSVVENVMINQVIPIGTGLPRIVMKKKGASE